MKRPSRHLDLLTTAYEGSVSRRKDSLPDGFRVQERQRFLNHLIDSGARSVLEIGCGAGHDAVFFQQHGLQVKAIDSTPGLVDLACSQGVEAELFSLYDLDSRAETYDAVYTVNCLLHVPNSDIESVFASIAARLIPSGAMYLGLWGDHNSKGIFVAESGHVFNSLIVTKKQVPES